MISNLSNILNIHLKLSTISTSSELCIPKGKRSLPHSKLLQEVLKKTTIRLQTKLSPIIEIKRQTPTNLTVEPKEEIKFHETILSG